MKRVLFEYLTLAEADELSKQVETLVMEKGYCKVLDLFDGESYWVKGVDIEGRSKNTKYNLDMILKVSIKNGITMIDNRSLEDIYDSFGELLHKPMKDFTDEDRWTWTQYMCLVMLNLKIAQDKEIIVSENKVNNSIKPSKYRYNPNKPVIIDNIVYVKKEYQGREYTKQADNWLVRAHYRVKNGVKYLVKGYKKSFK